MSTIFINNKEFNLSNLSDAAKQQLTNIQAVDAELGKLQQQMAIYQTARNAYVQALVSEVESEPKAAVKKTTRKVKTSA